MRNFVQSGNTLPFPAPAGGVAGGDLVVIESLFGVASTTAAAGESVEIAMGGVYELPKAPAAVLKAGAKVFWDPAAKLVVAAAVEGTIPIGVAAEPAPAQAVTAVVRLNAGF